MIDLSPWFESVPLNNDRAGAHHFKQARRLRTRVVDRIQSDLAHFAADTGLTEAQTAAKFEELFSTFAWDSFILVGADITTAIANDVTLAWLDTDASGQTIRARILSRLS